MQEFPLQMLRLLILLLLPLKSGFVNRRWGPLGRYAANGRIGVLKRENDTALSPATGNLTNVARTWPEWGFHWRSLLRRCCTFRPSAKLKCRFGFECCCQQAGRMQLTRKPNTARPSGQVGGKEPPSPPWPPLQAAETRSS